MKRMCENLTPDESDKESISPSDKENINPSDKENISPNGLQPAKRICRSTSSSGSTLDGLKTVMADNAKSRRDYEERMLKIYEDTRDDQQEFQNNLLSLFEWKF